MIDSIQIENLRSLKDTGHIRIKPITILIGGNSSGKSTFLRTFPLLTQTASRPRREALAWFDESLVDFGDFNISKTRTSDDDFIRLSFGFGSGIRGIVHPRDFASRYNHREIRLFRGCKFSVTYKQRPDGKGTYIDSLVVEKEDSNIQFLFLEKEQAILKINGKEFPHFKLKHFQRSYRGLLPKIEIDGVDFDTINLSNKIKDIVLLSVLKPICSKKFTHTEKLYSIWNAWNEDKGAFLVHLQKLPLHKKLRDNIATWGIENKLFTTLYDAIYAVQILFSLTSINYQLSDYFLNCDYVAPLRAEAARYYRNHGLQVNRVDAFGRNLSEFIDSLTDTQRDSLNQYMHKTLGVTVKVRNSSGHQSIVLINQNGETNMADVGFGYSQILPIVTKLWLMQERDRFNSLSYHQSDFATALIEQPELHLHPAFQAKLADAFIHAATNVNAKSALIIETHSPTIINRIGRRIREGHIFNEHVNVVIFEKDPLTSLTSVRQTSFDEGGKIKDWPSGFFEPGNDTF